jgi:hypothetical protein
MEIYIEIKVVQHCCMRNSLAATRHPLVLGVLGFYFCLLASSRLSMKVFQRPGSDQGFVGKLSEEGFTKHGTGT